MDVHTSVPSTIPPTRSEDEEIQRLLEQLIDEDTLEIDENNAPEVHEHGNDPIRWPTQDTNPINEYMTEGYIAMAFPTLFPCGKADL